MRYLPFLAALTVFVFTGCGVNTSKLERGYKASSEKLQKNMSRFLEKPEIQADLLKFTNEIEDSAEKAEAAADEQLGKPHTPRGFSNRVKLVSISDAPAFLRRDDSDLYKPYKSEVTIKVAIQPAGFVTVAIPVAANDRGEWKFPDQVDATLEVERGMKKEAQALAERTNALFRSLLND